MHNRDNGRAACIAAFDDVEQVELVTKIESRRRLVDRLRPSSEADKTYASQMSLGNSAND